MREYNNKQQSTIVKKKFKKSKKGNYRCCCAPSNNKNKCSRGFCCTYPQVYRRLDVMNNAKDDIKIHLKDS